METESSTTPVGSQTQKPAARDQRGTKSPAKAGNASAGSSCSEADNDSWITHKEARRIIGEAASAIPDKELSALLAQLYVIAGTAIDITIDDIDHMFEQRLVR